GSSAIAVVAASAAGLPGLGLAALIALGGAATGTGGAISVSNIFRSLKIPDNEPAPKLPERPSRPGPGELAAVKDRVHILITRDGRIRGTGADGSTTLRGAFDDDRGTADGVIELP